MISKKPEGYRDLLVYKKSESVQTFTISMVATFPRTKTFVDLADQMSRSARSVTKNIVEGWKRNTTSEYLQFLGFSVGSNSELMEDAADIVTGKYPELMGMRGVMGDNGPMPRDELDSLPFYPLSAALPNAVKLFLMCKEVNFLLYKLQQSLDSKMDTELTKPQNQRIRDVWTKQNMADKEFQDQLKKLGLTRLPNGQYIKQDSSKKNTN